MVAGEGGERRALGGGAGADGDLGLGESPIGEALADRGERRTHRQHAAARYAEVIASQPGEVVPFASAPCGPRRKGLRPN